MALDNPVLSNNAYFNGKAPAVGETATAQQLRDLYDRPAAAEPVQAQPAAAGQQTRPLADSADRLTYDGVIVKSFTLFGVLIAGAVIGWMIPALLVPGMIVGLVLGLVNSFKKQPSVPLILLYGAAEGVFIGAISGVFESIYPGVVVQAVIATFSVFGVTLALFASGKVRASARGAKILMIAMVGYMVFSLINVGMMLFGGTTSAFGLNTQIEIFGIPLGVIVGVLAVLMAAYSLVLDFDQIQNGVRSGAPASFGWTAAFGLVVTLVWLYIEFLRLFAILASSRD